MPHPVDWFNLLPWPSLGFSSKWQMGSIFFFFFLQYSINPLREITPCPEVPLMKHSSDNTGHRSNVSVPAQHTTLLLRQAAPFSPLSGFQRSDTQSDITYNVNVRVDWLSEKKKIKTRPGRMKITIELRGAKNIEQEVEHKKITLVSFCLLHLLLFPFQPPSPSTLQCFFHYFSTPLSFSLFTYVNCTQRHLLPALRQVTGVRRQIQWQSVFSAAMVKSKIKTQIKFETSLCFARWHCHGLFL